MSNRVAVTVEAPESMRDSEAASGIQGMQERALLVGGKLTIEPCVGGGTEITLAIPNGDQP